MDNNMTNIGGEYISVLCEYLMLHATEVASAMVKFMDICALLMLFGRFLN